MARTYLPVREPRVKLVRVVLGGPTTVQGRITERDLPLAEECFPGIGRMYAEMQVKPRTFLQLLWAYEGLMATRAAAAHRRARRRRA